MGAPQTEYLGIPREPNDTGVADAPTFNAAMDFLDALFREGSLFGDYHWKGPVANTAQLPMGGNTVGDARITLDTFQIYVWNGTSWQLPLTTDIFETYAFSRNAPITNAYLRLVDGTPSNLTGYPMFKASEIRFVSIATRSNSTCIVEVYRSGLATPIETLTLTNGVYASKASSAAIPVGEHLSVRINGGPAQWPVVTVIVE